MGVSFKNPHALVLHVFKDLNCYIKSNTDELVKNRKVLFSVIPAPHQVRDKLQSESSKFNTFWMPVADPVISGDRACPVPDMGSGMTISRLFTKLPIVGISLFEN